MKPFKQFITEQSGRKEYLEKEIEAARQRLAKTPVLSDAEMRTQNPGPTAAYEKDAAERKATRTIKVSTPEGDIIAGGTSKSGKVAIQTPKGKTIYVTPDEAVSRAEAQAKKPKNKITKTKKVKSSPKTPTAANTTSTPTSTPTSTVKTATTKSVVKPSTPAIPKSSRTAAQKVQKSIVKPSTPPTSSTPAIPKSSRTAAQKVQKSIVKPSAPFKVADTQSKTLKAAEREAAKTAEKATRSAARAASATKFLGNVGKAAGIVGSGLEAKTGYDAARASGASKKRALGAGAARALGALAGGALGGAAGGVLGVPGSVAGGIAGYTAGAELGTKAYSALTGSPKKDFKISDLKKNIKSGVSSGKKTFKDFMGKVDRKLSQY